MPNDYSARMRCAVVVVVVVVCRQQKQRREEEGRNAVSVSFQNEETYA